jgi:hypothetical protein
MIVHRLSWNVKPGYMDRFVELLKAELARTPQFKSRIYTSTFGTGDICAEEIEFENLAELDKFWSEWFAKPETAEFYKKFDEYREPGGENTLWNWTPTQV